MVQVTKRDGRKEPFVPEKIVVSMVKTGAPADYARKTAQDIAKDAVDSITTREIRKRSLAALREKNPDWERNWLVYDGAVKKRTG
ncbi:ATP cone domain-containing protein [Methanoregula formicica]|uniref:ATP cone domain-containing protein n=1 Tax=Methanoregula formicica (strain DSM 22288 / NBRC 105244 / SMSP) TaxID=593750 RepID=L0HIC5_METFS|nr:ATP cone domain-containing protein [Methanoregula formicica]AGB03775.1 ATP cone domain-containing protein [Methanoregula formicica SMSP]